MAYNASRYFGGWNNDANYNGPNSVELDAEARAEAEDLERQDEIHRVQLLRLKAYKRAHITPPPTAPTPPLSEPGNVRPELVDQLVRQLTNVRSTRTPATRQPVNYGAGVTLPLNLIRR
jgi:hypothetical protein